MLTDDALAAAVWRKVALPAYRLAEHVPRSDRVCARRLRRLLAEVESGRDLHELTMQTLVEDWTEILTAEGLPPPAGDGRR